MADYSPLIERVVVVAEDALARLTPGDTRTRVEGVRRALDQPLRVAVAGREKAGKSTFVNALLGTNIARTDAGVCTKVVTWYRHGLSQWVEVTPHEGEGWEGPLLRDEDGQAEIDLHADPVAIERVTVTLPIAVLRSITIIDTPGLASLNERKLGSTRDLLFMSEASMAASEKADALIYLLSPTTMSDDRQALIDFTERFGMLGGSAGNAVAVLSRADQAGDGKGDPWPEAERLAARQAEALAGLVSNVVPLVGLLAESSFHFRSSDFDNLREIAALDGDTREMILLDPRFLYELECPVPAPARRRLVDLLGKYGLAWSLAEIDKHPPGETRYGAKTFVDHLREHSGIERLNEMLRASFQERSDALRANAALANLRSIAWKRDDPNRAALVSLRDDIEAVELDPAMHRLREIRVASVVAANASSLPKPLLEDVHRLVTRTAPADRLGKPEGAKHAELVAAAAAGEDRWRSFASAPGTPLALRQVAEVFVRSHGLLYESLQAGA